MKAIDRSKILLLLATTIIGFSLILIPSAIRTSANKKIQDQKCTQTVTAEKEEIGCQSKEISETEKYLSICGLVILLIPPIVLFKIRISKFVISLISIIVFMVLSRYYEKGVLLVVIPVGIVLYLLLSSLYLICFKLPQNEHKMERIAYDIILALAVYALIIACFYFLPRTYILSYWFIGAALLTAMLGAFLAIRAIFTIRDYMSEKQKNTKK
jgi:hypothetical protein